MSTKQIAVLAVLGILILASLGVLGYVVINARSNTEVAELPTLASVVELPTSTPTKAPTNTPVPTITPIENWAKHEIPRYGISFYLPANYIAIDLTQDSQQYFETYRSVLNNDEYIDELEEFLSPTEYVFYAYDIYMDDAHREVFVQYEDISSVVDFDMNDYLEVASTETISTTRVVGRNTYTFNGKEVGMITKDIKATAGQDYLYRRITEYFYLDGDIIWIIQFYVDRDYNNDFKSTIETCVQSFFIE